MAAATCGRLLLWCLLASTGAAGPVLAQTDALGTSVQGLLAYARAQSPEFSAIRQEADGGGPAHRAGGLAGPPHATRAKLEQTAMHTELISHDSEKRQIRVKLNGLLARDGAAPLANPAVLRPLPPLSTADTASLTERARERNPLLQAALARLGAAQKNRELTQANRDPTCWWACFRHKLVHVSPLWG